jgi:very-short-patch-repair endonuclease
VSEEKPRGCLAALFGRTGGSAAPTEVPAWARPATPPPPSFRVREDFLSTTELSFFHALEIATRGRFLVLPKVNLGDVFFSPTRRVGDWNRISTKHVDFLLCDPQTLHPILGIELDDASHRGERARIRDAVKDEAFVSAGLNLLRVEARRGYSNAELVRVIDGALKTSATNTVPDTNAAEAPPPLCPSCGVPMVLRPAVKGRYGAFYGCKNYPRCRERKPGPSGSTGPA